MRARVVPLGRSCPSQHGACEPSPSVAGGGYEGAVAAAGGDEASGAVVAAGELCYPSPMGTHAKKEIASQQRSVGATRGIYINTTSSQRDTPTSACGPGRAGHQTGIKPKARL